MVFKVNYKIISFICAVLLVCIMCYAFESDASVENQNGVKIPIIMYHHILQSKSMLGPYVISPTEFENDLRYITEKGFTTVVIADLINYVEKGISLPENPIIITFDDGHESTLVYAYPLLEKYGHKAVVSIVGKYSDYFSKNKGGNVSYNYLTWDQINILQKSGLVEIQNHSYNMHEQKGSRKGAKMSFGESLEHYKQAMTEDLTYNQQKIKAATGFTPTCFTYPFGFISKQSKDIIKALNFKASLSCEEGISVITTNPESLYLLKRNNRPHGISTQAFFNKVLKGLY